MKVRDLHRSGAFLQPQASATENDDPILTPQQWFPVLSACILQYHREHPDHDRLWLKEHRYELYQQIVAQENEIDALGTVRLSELMVHIKEWRRLMLQAEFATADDERELFGGDVLTPAEFQERHGHPAPAWPKPDEGVN